LFCDKNISKKLFKKNILERKKENFDEKKFGKRKF